MHACMHLGTTILLSFYSTWFIIILGAVSLVIDFIWEIDLVLIYFVFLLLVVEGLEGNGIMYSVIQHGRVVSNFFYWNTISFMFFNFFSVQLTKIYHYFTFIMSYNFFSSTRERSQGLRTLNQCSTAELRTCNFKFCEISQRVLLTLSALGAMASDVKLVYMLLLFDKFFDFCS